MIAGSCEALAAALHDTTTQCCLMCHDWGDVSVYGLLPVVVGGVTYYVCCSWYKFEDKPI